MPDEEFEKQQELAYDELDKTIRKLLDKRKIDHMAIINALQLLHVDHDQELFEQTLREDD